MAKKLTKAEAMAAFQDSWNEFVKANPQWKGDTIAKREDWNSYTDCLQKDGQITAHQCNTWTNPY